MRWVLEPVFTSFFLRSDTRVYQVQIIWQCTYTLYMLYPGIETTGVRRGARALFIVGELYNIPDHLYQTPTYVLTWYLVIVVASLFPSTTTTKKLLSKDKHGDWTSRRAMQAIFCCGVYLYIVYTVYTSLQVDSCLPQMSEPCWSTDCGSTNRIPGYTSTNSSLVVNVNMSTNLGSTRGLYIIAVSSLDSKRRHTWRVFSVVYFKLLF